MRRFRDWIVDQALPFWSSTGFDARRERFHERFDPRAKPADVPHRGMLQARQIYVFAHASAIGWFPDGAGLADRAMRSLLAGYGERRGGRMSFAFAADRDGRIVSSLRDAYAHAFILLAMAWLYRVTGDPALLVLVDETIAFIDDTLIDPAHGGLYDTPEAVTDKRQNPLMHLLESYLALAAAAPGRGYLDRAALLVDLFERKLFAAGNGTLPEYFERDWRGHDDPARTGRFEPGHHFEWAWLLGQYAAIAGVATSPRAAILYRTALLHGRAPSGALWDELGPDYAVTKRGHRIWPHTEAIKAASLAGGADAAGFAQEMTDMLHDHFLDRPFAGGWIDQTDEQFRPTVSYVPASSLYHLFLAAAEAERLGRCETPPFITAH